MLKFFLPFFITLLLIPDSYSQSAIINGTTGNEDAIAIVHDAAGNYFVIGNVSTTGAIRVTFFNTLNQIQWAKTYASTGEPFQFMHGILLANGNLALGLMSPGGSSNSQGYIFIIDPSGMVVIAKKIFTSGYDDIHRLFEDTNGDIYVIASSGGTNGSNPGPGLVMRFDSSLNLLWSKRINTVNGLLWDIARVGNQYIIAGSIRYAGG